MSESDNVDKDEIKKFDGMASTWWDQNGPMKPLHQMNPLRVDYINQHHAVANQRILDVGCGGGILTEALAKKGASVTGIDMSQKAIHAAKEHAQQEKIDLTYLQSSIEAFAQTKPEPFDIITCLEMVEHVPNYTSVLATCQSLLKPNGSLFVSTINRTPKAYLFAIVGAEYVLRLLPRGTHEYAKFVQPAELHQAAETCQLKLNNISGVHYNPLTQHFKLTKNLSVNYITHYRNDIKN